MQFQHHCVIEEFEGLEADLVKEDEEQSDPEHPGLKRIGTLKSLGRYQVFSCILKDMKAAISPLEWKTLMIEQIDDLTYVNFPLEAIVPEAGAYVAFDIRIPYLKAGEKREVKIVAGEQRGPKKYHNDPDRGWKKRWLEHFGCEPPQGEGVVYELVCDGVTRSKIAFCY